MFRATFLKQVPRKMMPNRILLSSTDHEVFAENPESIPTSKIQNIALIQPKLCLCSLWALVPQRNCFPERY